MQSIADASSAVCGPTGTKRAASTALPCVSSCTQELHQPLLQQHDCPCSTCQVCSCKRQRTFNQYPSSNTKDAPSASARIPPSIIEHDTQNQEFGITEEVRKPDHEAPNLRDATSNMMTKTATSLSKIHNFYTKASILSPRGIVDLERVQVDERSSFNLLPLSIAMDLDLALYPDRVLTMTIANCRIQTSQYCRFTIRVAGFDTTINTSVISRLQTVLLGQEWIQSVKLLSGFGNQSYYIPIPLAVEAAGERFPDLFDAEVEAQNIELVETAMTNEISEEYDDDECSNADCGDDPLSDSELSPCELSSEDKRSLGDDPSGDELSEISFGEVPNFGEYELVQTDEDDWGSEDDEGSEDDKGSEDDEGSQNDEYYEDYEGEKCKGCEGDEEYEEYEEGQERQKGEDETDANLQDFMKQHKHLPFGRNDEPRGDPAFNMGSQQAKLNERVSTATVFRPC
jgi:hypothetical protein